VGERIRVYVADDHPMFRDALVRAVAAHPELELAGSAADGRRALEEIKRLAPDVAILDLRMPGLDGVGVTEALTAADAPTRVLLLSGYREGAVVHAALQAGAAGYLAKDASGDKLCQAALAVARGQSVLSPELQSGLFEQIRAGARDSDPRLSEHELQALKLAANGFGNREIAAKLIISPGTVKTYLHRAYEKLGAHDRGAAIAEAMRRGLIS
jgi:two-component system, NarL family, nitrate/nitrite response regulator NarL